MKLNIFSRLRRRRLYVVLDPADSSVTLSRGLFSHIRKAHGDDSGPAPKVFVFYVPALNLYAFSVGASMDGPAQLADIQYNSKYRTVGFETLNPTVARIFYDYRIRPHNRPCRLRVTPAKPDVGHPFYIIDQP